MKIFELIRTQGNVTEFPVCYLPDDNPWSDEIFDLGQAMTTTHDVPIKYLVDNAFPLYDYPRSVRGNVVTAKFLNVLEKLSSFLQIFPAEIYLKEKKMVDDFFTVVFTSSFPAIDWDNSICENDDGFADFIDKLVVSKEKLACIPASEKVFCMSEETGCILATEEGKEAIENAKVEGVDFVELELKDP